MNTFVSDLSSTKSVMAAVKAEAFSSIPKTYGRVVLTLENCLLPPERLSPTPSFLDGLDLSTETDLRILGCELIQTSGILLRLPQVAMATGQVLFQRFFYSKSFVKYNTLPSMMETVAMACINLASKIEEAPRRIRDVINVFHHIKQVRSAKPVVPLTLDQNYIALKNQVIKSERRVLKELGFCVHVKHPHKIIVMYLEVLECVRKQRLTQTAWNYMTDSLRTNVFVRYNPETIACACIYLAARQLRVPLPNKPAWYLIFNATEEDIQDICFTILRLYSRPKPDYEKLEAIVEQAKRIQQEAKQKAKGVASGSNTPNASNFSPNSRTGVSPKNSTRSPMHIKKEKSKEHSKNSSETNPSVKKEFNHSKKKSRSPSPRSDKSSSQSPTSSISPTIKRKTRTPPRGYKEIRRSRTRSRSREKITIKDKHRVRKRKHDSRSFSRSVSRSHSRSPIRINKKLHKEKARYHSRSRSRDRNYRSRSHSYEKPHKSRKDRPRDNGHRRSHSREKSRR